MRVVRTPRKKNFFVAFGADEPDSSEPVKGLKEGVFKFRCEVRGVFAGKKRMGQRGQRKGLVCISVLRFSCPY